MATDSSGSTRNSMASNRSRLRTSRKRVSFSKHLSIKCQRRILIGLGRIPTPWSTTVAKVGLTYPWEWGILLYHYCFLVTIIFINIPTNAAAATIRWAGMERELRIEDELERQ